MNVSILGAGAMGAALTFPFSDAGCDVKLWATEHDTRILELLEKGEEHPRIHAKLPENVRLLPPEKLREAVDADIVVLAISTEGVMTIFERVADWIRGVLVTVTKGLIESGEDVLTIPQAMWRISNIDIVAITGPAIAREVAARRPTKVVLSGEKAEVVAEAIRTDYFGVETTDDIVGAELTSALKNIYSIAIAWFAGYEKSEGVEMSNAKGVIAAKAIAEMADIVEASGGRRETVYGLSGFGDLIATFKGGRNGMLGELLGMGYSIGEALEELARRGVGVVEGYYNARKAYKLAKKLEREGKLYDPPLLRAIYDVLYEGASVRKMVRELIVG